MRDAAGKLGGFNFLRGAVGLLILLVLVAGCGDQTPTATPVPATQQTATTKASTAPATTAAQSTAVATTAPATTAASTTVAVPATATEEPAPTTVVVPPGSFQNPILREDFPDPFLLNVKGVFYAYATNGSGRNIQVATSTDLIKWEVLTDAMPALPSWAKLGGSLVWAPEVAQVGDHFVMYYTARDKASNKQCVGVATSDKPEGKFKDSNSKPFVCQADEGGTIDPDVFRDGDKLYLYFKNDGNCCSQATNLYAQELAPDGLSLVGSPTKLVSNDQTWEGRVVEAPSMFKHDNSYYLFYSGNDYAGVAYAVGYAACKGPLGPCEQFADNPILKSSLKNPPVIGPGHQTLIQLGDQTWIVYHAWEVSGGLKTSRRLVWMDRVNWKDGKPQVQGPTTDPQPAPKIKD